MRKLLIVDDHELFRSGLISLLSAVYPEFTLYEAESGEQALEMLDSNNVDLVVLDVDLPGLRGKTVLQEIRNRFGSLPVVMLTGIHSGQLVNDLIATGANAVLAKRGPGDELLDVLNKEFADTPFISETFHEDVKKTDTLKSLTPRENEMLRLLVDGLSTRQCAEQMYVSFKTAETHRTNLMSKLQVHSFGELLQLVREVGYLDSD